MGKLYTAKAIATGGRDGRIRSDDGVLDFQVCPYSNATRGNIEVNLSLI